ncbi:MAG: RimK family alpha-L-glutamate ligase [Planctomycetota bacterium]|nr:RimK family alpha-L-glutamate ligase [Planctomycetota bacterium]
MRIGIITADPALDSCVRLEQEATGRGHEWVPLELLRLAIRSSSPRLICNGDRVAPLDAAILRLGAVLPGLAVAAGRALEQDGVALIDPVDALVTARDKMESLQRLSRAGVAVPETELVRDLDQLHDAVKRLGGPPVVLKPLLGSQGRGAVLAESNASAVSLMESVLFLSREFILQRYIECGGQDTRLLVIGGEVVAAMERTAPPGDFRSNLHRGGVATTVDPTVEMKQLASRSASILGLRCAGVDILQGPDGLLVLEVNGSPGLAGIESTTGVEVASHWIDALEETVREGERCEQG